MILYTEKQIQTRIKSLAIEASFKNNLENNPKVMICVLKGAFLFFADLVKHMQVPIQVEFVQTKSYNGVHAGKIEMLKDVTIDLTGKDICIVDDMLDSGDTMLHLIEHFATKGCKSIQPIVLFAKPQATLFEKTIKGFVLGEESVFLEGYGLNDVNDYRRNQTFVTGKTIEID